MEEIFNKWRLLDDDIWCKLIIMERNRRIGKAYARVPIVTIDGSHELSYDGYKLALNGFENPDRDEKTEECRKRIGKGIRIKMDHFGNILIKRLSKSGVYIKEWLQLSNNQSLQNTNGIVNNSANNSNSIMPSRQQLIKNQMLALNGGVNSRNSNGNIGSQISSLGPSITPSSSSSGSSIDPPNDSAICDEVISVGGRLDLDKIYVMFDMKKFQANITQELCRPYPDKRKLEQQCFSIIGLARDADDILNLPCWVMVINIVAIEMLNERFPIISSQHSHGFPDTMLLDQQTNNSRRSQQQEPNFVSIFEQNNNNSSNNNGNSNHNNSNLDRSSSSKDDSNKEEDPYSLPANASSSDVKSSINDYSTTSTKNISSFMDNNQQQQHQRYYGASRRAEMYAHKKELSRTNDNNNQILENMKLRSKSNCNIYGPPVSNVGSRYINNSSNNNSSSIYSPGHMLVPPTASDHPPKLPPRDFVKKTKSKSSSNVNYDDLMINQNNNNKLMLNGDHHSESIYSTGVEQSQQLDNNGGVKVRKTKKNRFLESLKAPLELAKSSSNRSASVMGTPVQAQPINDNLMNGGADSKGTDDPQTKLSSKNSKTKGGFTKTGAKNLKSFLGVKSSSSKLNNSSGKDTTSDDSNYVHVDHDGGLVKDASRSNVEVDSVVDSNEDMDDSQQVATNSSSSASFNDLDIPTPDYETDENIYALEDSNYREFNTNENSSSSNNSRKVSSNIGGKNNNLLKGKSNRNNKEDLYYSGFLAHVPTQATNHYAPTTGAGLRSASSIGVGSAGVGGGGKYLDCSGSAIVDNKSSCNTREKSRFVMHRNARLLNASKLSGRDMIYGSTTGLSSIAGSRYRSASMQRYYPRNSSQHINHLQQQTHQYHQQQADLMIAKQQQQRDRKLGADLYDPDHDLEDPYAMNGSVVDAQGHYGITHGVVGGVHRRRLSSSKVNGILPYGNNNINGNTNNALSLHRVSSSMANSNYDIGRSSSGIYGNNSSSSSSDYADWHPQMRKVNSSGYLNSIFKNHISSPVDPFNSHHHNQHSNMLKNNNSTKPALSSGTNVYNKQTLQQQQQQQRNGTPKTMKSSSRQTPSSIGLSKQQQQKQAQTQQVAPSIVNGPTYRSYDSSNGKLFIKS